MAVHDARLPLIDDIEPAQTATAFPEVAELLTRLAAMTITERMTALNQIKVSLHSVSPMRHEPVDCVLWVLSDTVGANDYNPNSVAPPEMKLLELSILEDGYTQPIVTFDTGDGREVVDGFHRNRVGKECETVRQRVQGYLPVVTINEVRTDKADRIAATIRHNRARGKHSVEGMSQIIVDLKRRNWSDDKIGRELGMDPDEVLRLSQISGLAEMFADREFSQAWEAGLNAPVPTFALEADEDDLDHGTVQNCYHFKRRTAHGTGTCWRKADLYPSVHAQTHADLVCAAWVAKVKHIVTVRNEPTAII